MKLSKKEREKRDAEFQKERDRIVSQQALFEALPSDPAVALLKEAMLDRAWRLIDDGKCEEADAILEFLPEPDVTKLLAEYFDEEYENPPCPPKAATS